MPEAINTTYVRHITGEAPALRKFAPRTEAVGGCPACGEAFAVGDVSTLVPLGPGADDEAREKAADGRWFNAVAVEVHWACATGATDAA